MPLIGTKTLSRGIAQLTLQDADRRNAMSTDMASQFQSAIGSLADDQSVHALIVTGAGGAFSAGGDLKMLKGKADLDQATNAKLMLEFYHSFLGIQSLPFPTIAAINGHAIGAGLCMALACDFRIVATEAKLGFPFTRLGLHPGMGATLFLPQLVGHSAASDLLVTGRTFAAEEAVRIGIAKEVCPANEIQQRSSDLAQSLSSCGPRAVAGLLRTLRPNPADLESALQREAEEQSRNYSDPEFLEGITAAIEKRTAQFWSHSKQ